MADNKDKIVTSEDLREELNEERKARGEYEMPAVNPGRAGASASVLCPEKTSPSTA